jgi:diacylglycerol O-acyltransferase
MQVPLSLPDADSTTVDNQFTFGRIRIPVQLDDPVQVLTDLHAATERLNTAHMSDAERTGLTVDFATFAALIPPTVVHAGMQLYTGLGLSQRFTPICHGIASTISGPPVPVYCAGAKVVGMHTAAPLVEGCGLNITLISHGDVMDLSVCVCPDNVPAVNDIATGIVDSVGILVAAAQDSPRGERPSVLTQMTSHTQKRSHARH